MDPGLSIAASGLNATMAEIEAVSENLANSQTTGYVSESAQLATVPGGSANGVGDGVQVTSIAQATDALLTANNLQAQGSLSSLSSLQQVLTAIQNVFPLGQTSSSSSTASTNSSIAGQLSNFWSGWDSVAQDPSGSAARTQVVNTAQGLITTFGEASTQLDQLTTNTESEIQSSVGQVNSLLGQAATLNQAIVETTGSGSSPNQLSDQLNNVLNQLSSLAGVNVQMQQNGTALVTIGGIGVVQGTQAATLAMTSTTNNLTTPPTTTIGVSAYQSAADAASAKNGTAAPVSSGTLSGLLAGVNTYIPEYKSQLNSVASDLANTVNTQLDQGFDAAGSSGSQNPLFLENGHPISATNPVTAAGLTLNSAVVANPALIAAGGAQTTDTGSVLSAGTVSAAETLTVGQTGVTPTASVTTTVGESLTSIATALNSAFSSNGLSLTASLTNNGTQLQIADTAAGGTTNFQVSSTNTATGTTGLGGPTAGTAVSYPVAIGANDGSNAQAMAELGTASNVQALSNAALAAGTVTVAFASSDVTYQNLVEGVGSDTQNLNTQVSSQTSVANQAQAALQSVSGVDVNTQLTDLMNYQSNYQANAKVVSTIDAVMQSLLAAV